MLSFTKVLISRAWGITFREKWQLDAGKRPNNQSKVCEHPIWIDIQKAGSKIPRNVPNLIRNEENYLH